LLPRPEAVVPARPAQDAAAFARAVLEEQRRVLAASAAPDDSPEAERARGRIAAAVARAAANALRAAGDSDGAARIEAAGAAAPRDAPRRLDRAIADALEALAAPRSETPAGPGGGTAAPPA